jgi:hypothetical protein
MKNGVWFCGLLVLSAMGAARLEAADAPATPEYDWSLEEVDLAPGGITTDELIEEARVAASNSPMQIKMSTVGFDIGKGSTAETYLQKLADAGGGNYYRAEVGGQLTGVMNDAITGRPQGATNAPATPPAAPPLALALKRDSVAMGEIIVVVHSPFQIEDPSAWIAFYEKNADADKDYICYTFLRNLVNRVYDVEAPETPGNEYHFRLFKTKDYDCAARSGNVTVK